MTQIKKIDQIRSIGNYEYYTAHGNVSLKKFNFIYAENGAGKTTLASILHSLSNGNSTIIRHHKRQNATVEPLVEIKIDDNSLCRFDNDRWNKAIHDIEVFDTNFVAENVFTGMNINLENRRSLYKFVLGDEGVKISKKIARAKELIDALNARITNLSSEIMSVTNGVSANEVVKIQQTADIDKQIQQKEKERKVASSHELIRNHEALPEIQNMTLFIDNDSIKRVLESTIDTISQEYVNKVTQHIKDLTNKGMQNAQNWIRSGLHVSSNDGICPFCSQPLNNAAEIIQSYRQFFNKEYNALIEQIKQIKEQVDTINPNEKIAYIKDIYSKLVSQYSFWKNYIEALEAPKEIPEECFQIVDVIDELKKSLDNKLSSPLNKIEYTGNKIVRIKSLITDYLNILSEYTSHLKPKSDVLRNSNRDVKTIESELSKFRLMKKRYEEPLKSQCARYTILSHRLNWLKNINLNLQHKQKQESVAFLNNYGVNINHYLQDVFGTEFKIENVKDGGYKGKAKDTALEYQLTFNGQPLSLDKDDNLSVKNSLSEGDKNTIAFCIFLAKLYSYSDDTLKDKIVVFDDPLTSLDLNRRNATINELIKLYQRTSQIFVLSHNLAFLLELNSQNQLRGSDKKVLCIEKTNHKSSLVEFEFKDEYASKFAQAVENIEKFRQTDEQKYMEDAISGIRISLESYLKFKYGRYIPHMNQTFGQIIASLSSNQDCKFVDANKQQVIEDLNSLNAISWRAHHAIPEEIDTYTEKSISKQELHDIYIPRTLHLLFGRL